MDAPNSPNSDMPPIEEYKSLDSKLQIAVATDDTDLVYILDAEAAEMYEAVLAATPQTNEERDMLLGFLIDTILLIGSESPSVDALKAKIMEIANEPAPTTQFGYADTGQLLSESQL